MEKLVALCVEGVRRFGDDPHAIANFIELEIARLPNAEQSKIRGQMTLLTDRGSTQKPFC
jgi:hypothetical protein